MSGLVSGRDYSAPAARILLRMGAVKVEGQAKHKLTSGLLSPVYVDCRLITGYPDDLKRLISWSLAGLVSSDFDVVAGGETAGIAYAALFADRLGKPMSYIRKQPKGYGLNRRIEGAEIAKGTRVLLVEDMATNGGSKLSFIKAIDQAGGKCVSCSVFFYYNIFPSLLRGITMNFLTDLRAICDVGREDKILNSDQVAALEAFIVEAAVGG